MCNVSTSLARQRQFLPLLCALPNQETSIYQLLSQLEQRASIMLRHLNKAGNGSVPKATPPKPSESETSSSFNLFPKCFSRCRSSPSTLSSPSSSESEMAEEKLARYQTDKIITLYMNNIDYSGTFISWKLDWYLIFYVKGILKMPATVSLCMLTSSSPIFTYLKISPQTH